MDALRLRKAQRRLAILRALGWVVSVAGLVAVWTLAWFLYECSDLLGLYAVTLVGVLAFFHGLPRLLIHLVASPAAWVGPWGDSWRIGRYSEAELRSLLADVAKGLPWYLRGSEVVVLTRDRTTSAWTFLSALGLCAPFPRTLYVTAGSLHYLEPDELKAVLCHEIGHHVPQHRAHAPGGWLLADVALHAIIFRWLAATSGFTTVVPLVLGARIVLTAVAGAFTAGLSPAIEHLCDLFAASHAGRAAIANALLKMGEEAELTEVALARAAQELIHVPWIDMDNLHLAFLEVRPHGRIFHHNLFRHAKELVATLPEDCRRTATERQQARNKDLDAFLKARRARHKPRVRWRTFDADGDGVLNPSELSSLCQELESHPEHALVLTDGDPARTTHPSYRERILRVNELPVPSPRGA